MNKPVCSVCLAFALSLFVAGSAPARGKKVPKPPKTLLCTVGELVLDCGFETTENVAGIKGSPNAKLSVGKGRLLFDYPRNAQGGAGFWIWPQAPMSDFVFETRFVPFRLADSYISFKFSTSKEVLSFGFENERAEVRCKGGGPGGLVSLASKPFRIQEKSPVTLVAEKAGSKVLMTVNGRIHVAANVRDAPGQFPAILVGVPSGSRWYFDYIRIWSTEPKKEKRSKRR